VPILVLTLAGADERRAPLLDRLQAMGLQYELFFGVDGRRGLPAEHEPLVDRSARINARCRPMSDPEYACALSHLMIYRRIVERGLEHALILEDDAIIGSALAALALGAIGPVGDLMLLDHWKGFFRRLGRIRLCEGLDAHRVAVPPDLTTGYLVTRRAAGYFLDCAFPVRHVADWPCHIERLASYAVHPRIVDSPDQIAGPSQIRESRDGMDRYGQPKPSGWRRRLTGAYWRKWLRKRRYRRLDRATALDIGPAGPPQS
jgi:glycosyl transferase family 25